MQMSLPSEDRQRTARASFVPRLLEREIYFRLQHVSKLYKSKNSPDVVALTDVNLDVKRNEFVCLVGPSGCGKSTILRMLAGLSSPSSGTIERRTFGSMRWEEMGIGMVFQAPVLLPWKKILANVLFPAVVQKTLTKQEIERARSLLASVGLSEFESSYPHQLSGGMQQRAAICRALMCTGDVLLMDEPFGALDAITRDDLAIELKEICDREKRTVVFVTHSISEAVFLADRIVVLSPRPGRISEIVTVDFERKNDLSVMTSVKFQKTVADVRAIIQRKV
jgi:NitT/TauT family transport system ATP-binding protein